MYNFTFIIYWGFIKNTQSYWGRIYQCLHSILIRKYDVQNTFNRTPSLPWLRSHVVGHSSWYSGKLYDAVYGSDYMGREMNDLNSKIFFIIVRFCTNHLRVNFDIWLYTCPLSRHPVFKITRNSNFHHCFSQWMRLMK